MAVPDLQEAARLYETVFGMTRGLHRELPEHGVEVLFLHLPGTDLELLAPLGGDSPLTKFLESHGAGMHHLCYEVDDIYAALADCSRAGLELVDRAPRPGAEGKLVAFIKPTLGVLIELQQA